MSTEIIFPDTNIFVHYRRIREIDWMDLLGSEKIEIVIAPEIIRQLNKIKDGSTSRKRSRERATSALDEFRTYLAQPAIRDGVTVRFREDVVPEGPMSALAEQMSQIGRIGIDPLLFDRHLGDVGSSFVPRNFSGPKIRRTKSFEIGYHVRNLKHNFEGTLDPLLVVFDSWETAVGFTIDYRILAANIATPLAGKLDVAVNVAAEANDAL